MQKRCSKEVIYIKDKLIIASFLSSEEIQKLFKHANDMYELNYDE